MRGLAIEEVRVVMMGLVYGMIRMPFRQLWVWQVKKRAESKEEEEQKEGRNKLDLR